MMKSNLRLFFVQSILIFGTHCIGWVNFLFNLLIFSNYFDGIFKFFRMKRMHWTNTFGKMMDIINMKYWILLDPLQMNPLFFS